MDISTLDSVAAANDGIDIELLHPKTKKPIGLTVHILGHDSDAYQAVIAEQQRKRAEEASKEGMGALNAALSPEEMKARVLDLLVAATTGWTYKNAEGVVEELTLNEQPFPYSKTNMRELLRRWTWAKEQIDSAIHDRARFLKD